MTKILTLQRKTK